MKNEVLRTIAVTIGILLFVFSIILTPACCNKGESKYKEDLRVFGESEAARMLENYNEDYKLADKPMKSTIVRVLGAVDTNFDMVNNYISNVNGKIVEKETIKDEDYNMNAVIYTLEVPVDAKYSGELEDLFFVYSYYDYDYKNNSKFRKIFRGRLLGFSDIAERAKELAEEY